MTKEDVTPAKPICKECKKQGKTYGVTQGYTSITLMATPFPYWDEKGKYIVPKDPNKTTTSFSCTNGHTWGVIND